MQPRLRENSGENFGENSGENFGKFWGVRQEPQIRVPVPQIRVFGGRLTLPGTSRTIRSVQSGIWAMKVTEPLVGAVRSCTAVSESFVTFNRLAAALAKSQDRRASLGVFAFGRPDAVRRWSGLGYPAARASQSGERGLSPERGGERQSGRRESDGWLHTEVQVASGANCVEARLGSALLRDSPPEVRSKEYVSLWRNTQYRGVDIGKMEISVSLLRKVRGVSV